MSEVCFIDDVIERDMRDMDGTRPNVPARSALPFTLFGDIETATSKRWLVRGLLGEGEVSCAFGEPGSGKSVLVTDLAFAVAAGRQWFDQDVAQGAVVYIAAERAPLTLRRLAALRQRHGLPRLPLAVVDASPDLFSNGAGSAAIVETCRQVARKTGHPVRLLVIDTLARCMPGVEENSSRDVGRVVAAIERIRRETGAHVLVVHHAGKDNTRGMRGSTALLGAVDTAIAVEKGEASRKVTVVKSNDGEEGERFTFGLETEVVARDEATGEETTAPVVVRADRDMTGTRRNVPLTNTEALALRALEAVILDHGEPASGEANIPRGVRTITEDIWRTHCYESQISDSDKQDTRKKAFARAAAGLQRKGFIGVWKGRVWRA